MNDGEFIKFIGVVLATYLTSILYHKDMIPLKAYGLLAIADIIMMQTKDIAKPAEFDNIIYLLDNLYNCKDNIEPHQCVQNLLGCGDECTEVIELNSQCDVLKAS